MKYKIFVSSVQKELKDERSAVKEIKITDIYQTYRTSFGHLLDMAISWHLLGDSVDCLAIGQDANDAIKTPNN